MNFNIRNGSKLRYTIPAGDVGDNFLVVDPVTFEISFRTPAQVTALSIGGSSGDVLYNNAGVVGGFGDWNGSRLEIGGNFKLGEAAQSGSARAITADGSATDVGITITPKGAGAVVAGSATVNVGNSGDTLIDNVSSTTNSALTVRSKGTGSAVLRSPSGDVVLSAGNSSEVVLGESTTSASTRIISVAGTPSNIDLVLEPKGTGTVVSEANFTLGSTSLSGSSRTIQSGGSASDVSLVLASKGNGSVSLISTSPDYGSGANVVFIPNTVTPTTSSPTGGGTLYSSSKELIWFGSKSFNLVNQFVGKNINSVVANPTIMEDGQGLIWDNTAGQYTLGTLVASAGGTNTQIQYNNSGNLGGFGSWDGSTMTVPGSFQIGDTGTAGTNRNITAEGSVGNVSITLDPKGTANVILAVDGGQVNIGSGSGTTRTIQSVGSATDVSLVLAPQGAGSIYTNSNFYIGSTSLSGSDRILAPEGSGSNINLQVVPKGTGNLSLFSTTPTYGGGTGVVYIKSATGAPTGSITGGGALYVTPTAIRFVNSSGTDYDLTQTAQVAVRKNSTGGDIGLRRRINFTEGTNITMTITDDVGNDEIDVTINSSGGGGGYTDEQAQDAVGSILTDTSSINFTYDDATPTITADVIADSSVQRIAIRKNSTGGDTGTRRRLNFIEGSNISITLGDDGLDNELDVTIATTGLVTNPWVLSSGGALTANNTISGSFDIGFTNNRIGVGVAPASITANTRLDVRGISGGNALRIASDVNAALLTIANTGATTFFNTVSVSGSNNGFSVSGNVTSASQFLYSHTGGFNGSTGSFGSFVTQGTTNSTGGTGISFLSSQSITAAVNHTGFYHNPTNPTNISGTHLAFHSTSGQHLFGGATITAGSVLADFQSTTRGILVPRVTNIASISTPVNGMFAYDSTTNRFNFRENSTWIQIGSGTGDVVGPASATDNAIVRFDTTSGKLIQDSSSFISDGGVLSTTSAHLTASSSSSGYLRFYEDTDGGSNYIELIAPSDIVNTVVYTLPEAPAANDYLLSSTTGGVLSWVPVPVQYNIGKRDSISSSNFSLLSGDTDRKTETYFSNNVTGSYTGGSVSTNVLNSIPNNSTVLVKITYLGVQTSGTAGSSGFHYVVHRLFRRTTTTTTAIGSANIISSSNDTGDTFATVPTLTTSGSNINFDRNLTTSKTFNVLLKIEVDILV